MEGESRNFIAMSLFDRRRFAWICKYRRRRKDALSVGYILSCWLLCFTQDALHFLKDVRRPKRVAQREDGTVCASYTVQEKYTRRDKQRTREILYFIVLCTPIAHLSLCALASQPNANLWTGSWNYEHCVEFCARNVFARSSCCHSNLPWWKREIKHRQKEGDFFIVFAQQMEQWL